MDTASRQRVFKRAMPIVLVAPVLAIAGLFACDRILLGFAPVPFTTDSRLVGTWVARDNQRSYVFAPDGSGGWFRVKWPTGTGAQNLRWGTFGAVLITEIFVVDGWARQEYRYALSNSGKTLTVTRIWGDPGNKPHVLDRAAR